MSYKSVGVLDALWDEFIQNTEPDSFNNILEIKKLMTAKSVIDLSKHAIYVHMKYVHALSNQLITLRQNNPNNFSVLNQCRLWAELLRQRNQQPLKVRHHGSLDGVCSFLAALEMMEGKPSDFQKITRLNPENKEELNEALHRFAQLGRLAHGTTFAELPGVGDVVLASLLENKDSICLLARDKNNRIIGYSWGLLLRDFPIEEQGKANVFYIMDLVRDPDYYDPNVKVGAALREHWVQIINQNAECHFLAYQHIMNHQFHMDVIARRLPQEKEQVIFEGKFYDGKSGVERDNTSGRFIQYHFIRAHHNQMPFPDFNKLLNNIYRAFWHSAHNAIDFFSGALSFFGRHLYLHHHHDMFAKNPQKRISEPVTSEQQAHDLYILKCIIEDDEWSTLGTQTFFDQHVPYNIQKLRQLVATHNYCFEDLQQQIANRGISLMRRKITANFYLAMTRNSDPEAVVTWLVNHTETPEKWVQLISEMRQQFVNERNATI